MTTERFMVDDAGTLIDMQTRDMFDIVEEVCPLLNELHEKINLQKEFIEQLQQELVLFKQAGVNMGIDLNAQITALKQENEELKRREKTLLSEIEDFQELLAKNDNVCHKRVIDLIDDKIFNFSNVRAELLLHSDDDYRLEKLSFAIQNLRELKKELEE